MKKRILSLLLCIVMCLSLMPMSAFAEESFEFRKLPTTGVATITVPEGDYYTGVAAKDAFIRYWKENIKTDGDFLLIDYFYTYNNGYHSWMITIENGVAEALDGGFADLYTILYLINDLTFYDSWDLWVNGTYSAIHTHAFTYTANNGKITATCVDGCDDGYDTNPLTLTLTAPASLVYNGNAKAFTFADGEAAAWTGAGLELPTITYAAKSGSTLTSDKAVDAGSYTVSVTVDTDKTASLDFEITKATPYIKTNPEPTEIELGKKLADSTLFGGYVQFSSSDSTEVGGLFEWTQPDTMPAIADSNVTLYDLIFTPVDEKNYNTVTCQVTITVNHTHNPKLVNGQAPQKGIAGWKDYYECICGERYEDASGSILIPDLAVWKAEGGNGSLAPLIPAMYTVTFNMGNHGTQIDPQTVEEGNKATKPSDPTAEGWTFGGWYVDTDFSAMFDFITAINANTTIYAKWTQNPTTTYTVKYDANGGSGAPGNQTKTKDKALTLSSTKPTRSGYTFAGWNTAKDGSGKTYAPGSAFTANTKATLYAQWKTVTYVVSYDANGGANAPANQTKAYGADLTLSTAKPTRDGYTFASWNTSKDGKGTKYAAGASYIENANVTLYAQWTQNPTTTYTVKYDANGGSGAPGNQTKTKDKALTLSSTKPTRSGYTFASWNTAKDGKGTKYAAGASYTANANVTLYAQWTKNASPTNPPASGVQLKRLAGAGRQQTAALISKEAYSSAENVFIASGDNAADALAGVPLASAMNAPILLIRPGTGLDNDTKAEIQRLKAKNVYILGGEGAIPASVEKEIQKLGCMTNRIAGSDRFSTAVEIANKLKAIKGSPTEVFFVYSHNYPDALAVSGVAAVKGAPILYVYSDGDLRASAEFMSKCKTITKAYIIGGYGAINETADANVKKYAPVQRVFGDNRYLTCAKINQTFDSTLTGKAVCIATGKNFPDALAGGVLAAKTKSPMLLVGTSLLDYQSAYVKAKKPNTIYVFGGTGAVSDKIANDAVKAAK